METDGQTVGDQATPRPYFSGASEQYIILQAENIVDEKVDSRPSYSVPVLINYFDSLAEQTSPYSQSRAQPSRTSIVSASSGLKNRSAPSRASTRKLYDENTEGERTTVVRTGTRQQTVSTEYNTVELTLENTGPILANESVSFYSRRTSLLDPPTTKPWSVPSFRPGPEDRPLSEPDRAMANIVRTPTFGQSQRRRTLSIAPIPFPRGRTRSSSMSELRSASVPDSQFMAEERPTEQTKPEGSETEVTSKPLVEDAPSLEQAADPVKDVGQPSEAAEQQQGVEEEAEPISEATDEARKPSENVPENADKQDKTQSSSPVLETSEAPSDEIAMPNEQPTEVPSDESETAAASSSDGKVATELATLEDQPSAPSPPHISEPSAEVDKVEKSATDEATDNEENNASQPPQVEENPRTIPDAEEAEQSRTVSPTKVEPEAEPGVVRRNAPRVRIIAATSEEEVTQDLPTVPTDAPATKTPEVPGEPPTTPSMMTAEDASNVDTNASLLPSQPDPSAANVGKGKQALRKARYHTVSTPVLVVLLGRELATVVKPQLKALAYPESVLNVDQAQATAVEQAEMQNVSPRPMDN